MLQNTDLLSLDDLSPQSRMRTVACDGDILSRMGETIPDLERACASSKLISLVAGRNISDFGRGGLFSGNKFLL